MLAEAGGRSDGQGKKGAGGERSEWQNQKWRRGNPAGRLPPWGHAEQQVVAPWASHEICADVWCILHAVLLKASLSSGSAVCQACVLCLPTGHQAVACRSPCWHAPA